MANIQQGILTSIQDEEPDILSPTVVNKVKNKKNAKAAGAARAAGAQTVIERTMQATIDDMQVLSEKKDQEMQTFKATQSLNIIMDKMGQLTPERLFSEEGFQSAKQLMPSLDKDTYFNALAPNSVRRRKLTKQLEALPVGTVLPPQTLETLKGVGIENPNKYMSLAITQPPNTLVGAVQQTAISQARSGDPSAPLGPTGQQLILNQERVDNAISSFHQEEVASIKQKTQLMTDAAKKEGGLNTKQKADFGRGLSKDLQSNMKNLNIQFEFWKNIQDFSDPSKSFETVRLLGNDTLPGGFQTVSADGSFQNVHDIALIYSFIKMLDPASVVREGEVKLAGNSTGFLEGLGISAEKIFTGQTLSDKQRAGILSVANRSLLNGSQGFEDNLQLIENNIDDFALNRKNVISGKADKMLREIRRLSRATDSAIKSAESTPDDNTPNDNTPNDNTPKSTSFNVGNIKVEVLPD